MAQVISDTIDYFKNLGYEIDEYCQRFKEATGNASACLVRESHKTESLPGYSCYVDTYCLVNNPAESEEVSKSVFTSEIKEMLKKIMIPAGDYKKFEWEADDSKLTVTY